MKISSVAVLAATAALLASAIAQGLPTQKLLTVDVAQAIAQEAMTKCRADGYKVCVTVVDGSNLLKILLRDDGAALATVEIGRMKANNVMAVARPSGPPANLPAGTPPPPALLPIMTNAAGGLPILVGDQLIGAVAVSGAPTGEKDAACAQAGLVKVADKLK
jgi:uncharacterized protein GlcG (DUF336 family)